MRAVALRLVLILAALMAVAPPASASPATDLSAARDAFRRGDCDHAVVILNKLLYPQTTLASQASAAEAHLLLGVCYFKGKDQRAAEHELLEALYIDPKLDIDGLFSDDVVALFNRKKAELARQSKRDAEGRKIAEERDAYRRALENLIVIEKREYYVNFIPFGAGQFQNGDTKKGMAFFISEAALGGASLTLYAFQVLRYGFSGAVPRDEADQVYKLQVAQIATGGLCLGLMAWGIIDALLNYQPTIQRVPDESLFPEGLDLLKNNPAQSLYLFPAAGDDWAGLSLRWEL
ncbi:MAG TPA: hypothetical protein VFG83_05735 [Kofleriaceae bacterium]|nr:hypothetical protein [Kofleriaceae bacterium]